VKGIPDAVRAVLDRGILCHLAAPSPAGPHVTPVVFVRDGDRLWGTTGRGTTKAARWRRAPAAGGLVVVGDAAVTFRGAVTLYDGLDPSTWWSSATRAPQLARASARFTVKNARFFAGYARDAAHVPLAWTPPARVVFSVDLDAVAILEDGRLGRRWGIWDGSVQARTSFRRSAGGLAPDRFPQELRDLVDRPGWGTLGLDRGRGPAVVPCRWVRSGGTYHAVVSRGLLQLAGASSDAAGSLVIDRASTWRAARMQGLLLRGPSAAFVPSTVRSGATSLAKVIAEAGRPPDDPAVVRITPRTAVWWSGWSSGTVGRR
jgi:nitroimidazol reductase NimA-like FMN-containing flavoprotein (pyridoxamine 5'-phosphate oxidase superfamily)